jgi:hypothetical protein
MPEQKDTYHARRRELYRARRGLAPQAAAAAPAATHHSAAAAPPIPGQREQRYCSIQSPVVPTTTDPFYAPPGLQQNDVPMNDRSLSAAPFPPELAFPNHRHDSTTRPAAAAACVSPRTTVVESSAPAQLAVAIAATARC